MRTVIGNLSDKFYDSRFFAAISGVRSDNFYVLIAVLGAAVFSVTVVVLAAVG